MLSIATANVNTLLPWEEATTYGKIGGKELLLSKVQLLEYEFDECQLHIVGVQEGRSPDMGVKEGLYYKMLCAPGVRGNYGVQLWIRRSMRYELLAWDVVSARLLWAAVKHKNDCVVLYLVGHAPTEMASEKERSDFFDEASKAVQALSIRFTGAEVAFLIDANAKLGSVASEYIGGKECARENKNGSEVRMLLEKFALFAVNTFYEAGYTWKSSRGPTHRIDYVLLSRRLYHGVHCCRVMREIDLTFSKWEDHSAVMVGVFVHPGCKVAEPSVKAYRPSPCKWRMSDPIRVQKFQDAMWAFAPTAGCSVTEHCQQLTEYTQKKAINAFGCNRDSPRQPWISWQSWNLVRCVAPLRRALSRFARARNTLMLCAVMAQWAMCVHGEARDEECEHVWALALHRQFCLNERVCAGFCSALIKVRKLASVLIASDREGFLYKLAAQATAAARRGDFRVTYASIRILKGTKRSAQANVRLANGEIAASRHECDMRWQEHFCEVTGGKIVPAMSPCVNDVAERTFVGFRTTPASTEAANCALPSNKGTGPDGIPAEVLKAGGAAVAVKQTELQNRVGAYGEWPRQWQGGRCVPIHKQKGPKDVCDEYRGLLLADHMSKSFVSQVKTKLDTTYNEKISLHQYGAVPGRGADFGHHVILSIHERAKMLNLSVFTLFIDLSKAFDKVPRELVMGWPRSIKCDTPSRIGHLRDMGIGVGAATHIHDYLRDEGCLLQQWGVSHDVIEMLSTLHDGCWLTVGEIETVIEYGLGGRQGCKVGASIFNSAYDIPLRVLRAALVKRGVALHLPVAPCAFWACDNSERKRVDTKTSCATSVVAVDAAFIDDECIAIMSPSNADMANVIEGVVGDVASIFALFGLEINWKPGKTEAMLHARGIGSNALLARFCHDDGRYVHVPAADGSPGTHRLHIVRRYKHLGGYVQSEGGLLSEARWRAQQAMAAYAPMAYRVFGCPAVCLWLRYLLLQSMILSRLLYMVHTLVPTPKFVQVIQSVYMRVLRRMHDQCSYQRTEESDLELRRRIQQPSIDCLMMRARLRYFRRLVLGSPKVLVALLHSRVNGARLPWCELLICDLKWLRLRSNIDSFCSAPCPDQDPHWWYVCACSTEWCARVSRVYFVESVADPPKVSEPAPAEVQPFRCPTCSASFPDSRRLSAHRQRAHNWRKAAHRKVDGSGMCPVCGATFKNRIDVLKHLANVRACSDALESEFYNEIPTALLRELEDADRRLRLQARHEGRSTPMSGEALKC